METIETYITFAHTIFSNHPKISEFIEICNNNENEFTKIAEDCIVGNFEIPTELIDDIEILKYDIEITEASCPEYIPDGSIMFDIDCSVTFTIKSNMELVLKKIDLYHEENDDLRWNIDIKWIDLENNKTYLFDSWDEDFIEELIDEQPFLFENK
jgi:hypothetical protein